MKNYVTKKMLTAQGKMKQITEEFVNNQQGDTNFVSIILIIVIVIALATMFQDTLTEVAGTILDRLTEFVG